jgi:hypothetical protein
MTMGIWLVDCLAASDCSFAPSHYHVDRQGNQLLRIGRKPVHLTGGITLLHHVIPALDIAEVPHAQHKLVTQVLDCRIFTPATLKIAKANELALLRPHSGGPCHRSSAYKRDEIPSPHVLSSQPEDTPYHILN